MVVRAALCGHYSFVAQTFDVESLNICNIGLKRLLVKYEYMGLCLYVLNSKSFLLISIIKMVSNSDHNPNTVLNVWYLDGFGACLLFSVIPTEMKILL